MSPRVGELADKRGRAETTCSCLCFFFFIHQYWHNTMGKGQATTSSSKGKGKAKSSASGPIKGKVESLLGNGEALSASVFLGYGSVNLMHDLHPANSTARIWTLSFSGLHETAERHHPMMCESCGTPCSQRSKWVTIEWQSLFLLNACGSKMKAHSSRISMGSRTPSFHPLCSSLSPSRMKRFGHSEETYVWTTIIYYIAIAIDDYCSTGVWPFGRHMLNVWSVSSVPKLCWRR